MLTVEQCENRNKAIIENAIEWANNRECDILEPTDVVILGDYFKVKIPTCFYHFVNSSSPNSVKATGAFKTIFKTIDKLKDKIIKSELNNK